MNRSTAQRSRRTQDQAPTLALSVISGVHRGVTYALESRDCRIGSAADADIVLRDAGIAAEHARLRLERGVAYIEATGGDIIVDGEPVIKGRGCRTRLPVRLRLCDAELQFMAAPSPASGVAGILEAGTTVIGGPVLGAALIICLAYGLSAMAQESPHSTDARDAIANIKSWARVAWSGGSRNSGGITRAEPRSTPRPGSPPRIDEAERELKARLSGARLGATRVDAAGGRLAVSGQIGKHDVAAWTGIQQWFDQTYGDHLVLTTTVSVADDKAAVPALQPQAIWYGDGAYVVAADGVRYYEGAVLESGWTIQSIDADRILLSRDGQTMALAYQ
jgi:hypothetical protein